MRLAAARRPGHATSRAPPCCGPFACCSLGVQAAMELTRSRRARGVRVGGSGWQPNCEGPGKPAHGSVGWPEPFAFFGCILLFA